jgi:hypothetical protein
MTTSPDSLSPVIASANPVADKLCDECDSPIAPVRGSVLFPDDALSGAFPVSICTLLVSTTLSGGE